MENLAPPCHKHPKINKRKSNILSIFPFSPINIIQNPSSKSPPKKPTPHQSTISSPSKNNNSKTQNPITSKIHKPIALTTSTHSPTVYLSTSSRRQILQSAITTIRQTQNRKKSQMQMHQIQMRIQILLMLRQRQSLRHRLRMPQLPKY